MIRTQVVAGIIENARGEVLLAKRPPGKRLAGHWEFPGGKVEAGESSSTALARELKEELQLDVRIVDFLGSFPHSYAWGEMDLLVFRVMALSLPQATAEVQEFRWLVPQQVRAEQLTPADIAPLNAYLKLIEL